MSQMDWTIQNALINKGVTRIVIKYKLNGLIKDESVWTSEAADRVQEIKDKGGVILDYSIDQNKGR